MPDVGIPLDVPQGGGTGGEAPVVDVLTGGGVTLDNTVASNPLEDRSCLLVTCKALVDRFKVEESEPVVVALALVINTSKESPVRFIPKEMLARLAHFRCQGAEFFG